MFYEISNDFKVSSRYINKNKSTGTIAPLEKARRVLNVIIHITDRIETLTKQLSSDRIKQGFLFEYISQLNILENSLMDFFAANPDPTTNQLRNKINGDASVFFGLLGEMKASVLTRNVIYTQIRVKDILPVITQKRLLIRDKKRVWQGTENLEIDLVQKNRNNKQAWIEVKYVGSTNYHGRKIKDMLKRARKLKRLTKLLRQLNIDIELQYFFLGKAPVSPAITSSLKDLGITVIDLIK